MEKIITVFYSEAKYLKCCCTSAEFDFEVDTLVVLWSQMVQAIEMDDLEDISLIIDQMHFRVEHSDYRDIRELRPHTKKMIKEINKTGHDPGTTTRQPGYCAELKERYF